MSLYDKEIENAARLFGLEPALVKAVCHTESNFNPVAQRFEGLFLMRYLMGRIGGVNEGSRARDLLKALDTETVDRATSFGLMQIMGQVAREHGYKRFYLASLLDPETNILWGCKHLKSKIDKYGLPGGIAAYNQGNDRKNPDGSFKNQVYVDRILYHQERYEDDFG